MRRKTLVLFGIASAVALAACQSKQEPPPPPPPPAPMAPAPAPGGMPPGMPGMPGMPPSHGTMGAAPGMGQPPAMPPVPREVVVPDDIKKTWKAVVLQVTDKATKKTEDLKVDIGKSAKFGDLEITVESFLPDFTMAGGAITSKSNQTQNPAAKLVIKEKGNQVYSGWRFSLYPQAHPMNLEKYDIMLKDFVKKS